MSSLQRYFIIKCNQFTVTEERLLLTRMSSTIIQHFIQIFFNHLSVYLCHHSIIVSLKASLQHSSTISHSTIISKKFILNKFFPSNHVLNSWNQFFLSQVLPNSLLENWLMVLPGVDSPVNSSQMVSFWKSSPSALLRCSGVF